VMQSRALPSQSQVAARAWFRCGSGFTVFTGITVLAEMVARWLLSSERRYLPSPSVYRSEQALPLLVKRGT
jgi:hypothetical protein